MDKKSLTKMFGCNFFNKEIDHGVAMRIVLLGNYAM